MSTETNWLALWYEAAASQCGVVLAVSDVGLAKQALYRARASACDPSLEIIQVRTSPDHPDTELWLVKGPEKALVDGPQV